MQDASVRFSLLYLKLPSSALVFLFYVPSPGIAIPTANDVDN